MSINKIKENYDSIMEKAFEAFSQQYDNTLYITVYIDGESGKPYIFESVSQSSMPTAAWEGKDITLVSYHGSGEGIEYGEDDFKEDLLWNLTEDEEASFEAWKETEEYKAKKEDIWSYEWVSEDEKEQELWEFEKEWIEDNTKAYNLYKKELIQAMWDEDEYWNVKDELDDIINNED